MCHLPDAELTIPLTAPSEASATRTSETRRAAARRGRPPTGIPQSAVPSRLPEVNLGPARWVEGQHFLQLEGGVREKAARTSGGKRGDFPWPRDRSIPGQKTRIRADHSASKTARNPRATRQ